MWTKATCWTSLSSSVVAAKGDQTQNGAETATVRWWPDPWGSRYRQRETWDDRGIKGGRSKRPQPAAETGDEETRDRSHAEVNSCADPPRDRIRHHRRPSEGQRPHRRIGLTNSKRDTTVKTSDGHAGGCRAETGT